MTTFLDMSDLSLQQQMMVNQTVEANKKNKTIMVLLWFFLATLGGHRFYLGNTGYAIFLIACGWLTLFIWPLLDIIFALKEVDRQNAAIKQKAINEMRLMNGGHESLRKFVRNDENEPSETP